MHGKYPVWLDTARDGVKCNTMQSGNEYSTVQYSAVQYSTMQRMSGNEKCWFLSCPGSCGWSMVPPPHWATLETPDCATSSPEPEQY